MIKRFHQYNGSNEFEDRKNKISSSRQNCKKWRCKVHPDDITTLNSNESLSQDLDTKISDEYKDLKSELLDLIEKSVNSSDMRVVNEFIDSFLQDDSESVIEGLVNDSDVYEFYLKHTDSIDEILNDGNFFDTSAKEHGVFGLYDYMVYGTRKAVKNAVNRIKNEIS